eukprot:12419509-Alexandrium_andersonii.AAC.1
MECRPLLDVSPRAVWICKCFHLGIGASVCSLRPMAGGGASGALGRWGFWASPGGAAGLLRFGAA